MLAVVYALGASLLYAVASVLQQREARRTSQQHALRLSLLVRLVRRPSWTLGVAADVGAYVLQFLALGLGSLVLVQPLLVSGLLFALPLGAWLSHRRLAASDWLAAGATCVGLAAFLVAANPDPGVNNVSGPVWAVLLLADAAVAGALMLVGRGRARRQRALFFSCAAGVIYGVTAALTKTTAHLLNQGVLQVLTHWQPYGLAIFGVAGMVVVQSGFQVGSLDVSLPALTVVDPVVSILVGALAFGEAINTGFLPTPIEVGGLIAVVAGVGFLAYSRALRIREALRRSPPGPSAPPQPSAEQH